MTAFSHSTAFLLGAALLISCAAAAPAPSAEEELAQSQAIDLPNESAGNRCYYNFQHYEEGDRIVTNEPCLNCTCHKRMLMCYLRVCPFTKAVGQDCTVEKRPDQCCPVITCPQVPVDVLTSSTTTEATSTAVGHLSNYGCTLEDNTFYPDGVQMPSDPRKPCELCYCIRNHTACVRQECTLNVEGCRPVYQEGVCCPVRYDCDYNEISTEQPSTFGGGLLLSSTASPLQCRFGDTLYNDGELIESDKPCESCYCMRGDIVCAVRSCGEPLAGKECEAVPPPEGQCCPTSYKCANGTIPVEALGTESSIIMHTTEIETQEPSKEPEVSIEGVSNPEVLEAKPEATSTSQEENPENIEAGTPEENELHVVPENVESDPLNVDELEEENTLHEASQNSDAKPSDATEKPSALSEDEQTSAPVTETEPQEVDIATTAPVAEESDAVQPSEGDQTQVSPDSQDVPIEQDNLEQQHLPVVTDLPQPEDHSEINTDNKVEESESTPSVSTEGGFLETPTKEESNSDSQAQANVEPKPVEDEADEVATLNPANEIQPEKGDIVPETLDQVKYPESNVESEPVSVTSQENNVKADAKPDEGVPLAPSSSEGEAVLETTQTLTPVDNESTKKEPVPPRKEDAAIEEPHPTQHAEGSATKADDSVPTDLSYTGAETTETSDEVESNPETEGQTIANINPTQTSDAEVFDHENEAVHENVDVQTESPASESPEIASPEHSPEEHFDASPSGSVSDEKESNPTTDEIKPLENAAIEGDNLSSQGESVPNVVVTESELPTEKVPEESNADKEIPLKTPSETSDDSNVEEDVLGLVTEKPESQPTEIQPDVEHLSTDSKTTGAGDHENSEQSEDKIVLETTSTPASDTPSNDDESSTKENEIGDVSGETLIPAKQEVSSPTENVASSTDKIKHTINAERDQTETEENEINSEQTDVKIDNNDAVKDTQTESNENQETTIGSDTLIKVGSGSQPETEEKQTQENALPSESKPDETQPLQPEATPAQETETNEFQVVEHDPTDLENSDFEEQELVDNEHHIHDGVSSENEIIDGDHQIHGGSVALKPSPILPGPAGIPGEGDCLVDGKTYSNNSEIPSKSRCHKVCTCLSSIVHCQGIDCEPPPPHLADCMPVHHADLCCPVYTCDGSSNESPDAGSQILTGPGGDNHEPAPTSSDNTPTLGNSGEEAVPILTSGPAVEEAVPEATALTPEHSDDGENSHPEDIKQPETSGDNSEETPEGSDSETPHHNEGPSQDVEGHSTESKLENADPQKPSEDVADSEIQTQSPQSSDTGEKIPEVNSVSEAVTASNEEVAENPPEGTNHPATVQEITSDSPTVVEEHLSSQSEESNVDSQSTIATDTIIEEGAKPAEADILEEEVTSASIETGSDEKGTEASNSNENSPEGHTGRPAIDHIEDDSVPATVSPAESEDVKMPIEELYEDVTGTNSPPEPIVASEDVSPEHPAHDDSSEVDHDVPGQESESHKDDVQQEPSAESFTELPNAESDHSENPMNGIESEQPQTTDVNEEQPANENEVDTVTHSVVLGPEFDPTKVADDYESNKEDFADNEKEIVPVTELHVEEEDGVHVSSEESQTVQPTLEADSHQEEASVVSYDHDDSHEMETDTDSNQTIETNDTVVAEEHEDQKPETSDTENESETHSSDTLNIETTQSSTISSSESVQDQVGNEIETINEEHTANTVSNSGHSTVVPDEEVDISTKGPDISEPSESISAEENIVKLPEVELDDLTNVGHDNEPVNEENTVKLSEVESDVLTNEGQDNEPVIEHQETTQESVIPLEESATNNPVDESSDQTSHSTEEAHSDKEENVVSETEIPVVEPVDSENPAQESEPVIIPDLPLEHEQPDHETLQPTQDVTSEPLEESEDEHVESVAPESEFEETAKPEEIEPSYQGNSHDVPAATDEPAQEEEKPTHGEDNKEEQASVPSYEEEATSEVDPTHHDSEKATQTEETPTSEVNPTHHDSQQETQPVEEPNSEVDPTHHDSEPPAQTDENPTSEVDPTHHTPESAPQTEEESHIPDHPAPEHPTEDESILSNIAEGLEDELKPSLPVDPDSPTEDQFPTNPADIDYDVNEDGAFGPGTCRYGGKVYVSAQQIPRDDPCDFCFCFRSDIICLQQSCPPPIHRCHQEPIQGYCCPRYQCPVSMATSLNLTTTTTTTTTTLPPHFFAHAYHGAARQAGCLHKGRAYSVGEEITSASGPCLRCMCGSDGQMKCDPVVCSPEPMLRKMMEAAISHRRR